MLENKTNQILISGCTFIIVYSIKEENMMNKSDITILIIVPTL